MRYRETLEYFRFSFSAFVSVSSDLARGIFCSTITDQLTEHDICTSDAHCFRIGSLRWSREKLPNRRIRRQSLFNAAMCLCPWLVRTVRRDWQHSLRNAQRKNCRHKLYKIRNLLLLLLLCTAAFHCRIIAHCRIILAFWRPQCMAISRYMSL